MAAGTEAWTEGLAASLAEIKRLAKEISNVWIYSVITWIYGYVYTFMCGYKWIILFLVFSIILSAVLLLLNT